MLITARPCLEERFDELEPTVIEVLNRLVDMRRQCYINSYDGCMDNAPELSKEDFDKVSFSQFNCPLSPQLTLLAIGEHKALQFSYLT